MEKLQIQGLDEATCAVLARARKFNQYCKAVEDALAERCPFCDMDFERNLLLIEGRLWWVTQCNPPEPHTRVHLLFIPLRHVLDIRELTKDEVLELHGLQCSAMSEFDIPSCGLLCRNGDATLSAGTVRHLHVHMMVPDGTGRVESPFYKGAEAEAEGHLRAIVFEKLRTGTKFEDLTADEQRRVEGKL